MSNKEQTKKSKSVEDSTAELDNSDRRRAPRRPIIDTFSFFISIPSKGPYRLKVHDVSELGIGFDFDAEGEGPGLSTVAIGDELDLHFYLNQSLYIPIKIKVVRLIPNKAGVTEVRKIGAEFVDKRSKGTIALEAFVKMIDQLSEIAMLER